MMLWRGDRRKYKRYKIGLEVDYTFTKLWDDVVEKGTIRDISYGGFKLNAQRRLNQRSHFVISIKSEALDIDITVTGKAKWIRKNNGTTSYGIKLNWASDEDAYRKYIKTLEEADKIY